MGARNPLLAAFRALGSLFYPAHCAGCGFSLEADAYVCAVCLRQAKRIKEPRCETCSQPFDGAIEGAFTCANCEGRRFHFTCAISPYRSRGIVRELIHRFKYDRQLYLRHVLARWLADGLNDSRLASSSIDAVVPVPLHPRRQREREFNQADVLAKLLAPAAHCPVLPALRRVRYTSTQTRLDRQERMENLRNAFQMRKHCHVQGKNLVLIDDVLTTGSTVDECARVLREADAASVTVLTIARG
jgi:competence protein ComFC